MTKASYKKLISQMLVAAKPSGLSYAKIVANFKRDHPNQCRLSFVRRALQNSSFRLSRKKYFFVAAKKNKAKKKKPSSKTVASPLPTATTAATVATVAPVTAPTVAAVATTTSRATVFDNSTVVTPLVPTAPGESVPQWQYEHDGWRNYDKTASDVVEAAYQEWRKNPYTDVRAIKSGEWQYTVDFNTMMQQNIVHSSHTSRAIRRALIAVPATPMPVSAPVPVIAVPATPAPAM